MYTKFVCSCVGSSNLVAEMHTRSVGGGFDIIPFAGSANRSVDTCDIKLIQPAHEHVHRNSSRCRRSHVGKIHNLNINHRRKKKKNKYIFTYALIPQPTRAVKCNFTTALTSFFSILYCYFFIFYRTRRTEQRRLCGKDLVFFIFFIRT